MLLSVENDIDADQTRRQVEELRREKSDMSQTTGSDGGGHEMGSRFLSGKKK